MGCGKSKDDKNKKDNSDKDIIAEKKFNKLNSEIAIASHVILKDLLIENTTYLDLLTTIATNKSLTNFTMENVEIKGDCDVLINLANTLKYHDNLKSLELFSLDKLGIKKGKSIARIMYDCPKIEKLIIKEIDLEEEDSEFIGSLLTNYSPSLIHFELCGIFFNDLTRVFEGMKGNNIIQILVLNKIKLTSDVMSSFLPAIENNVRLIRLDLSNNPIKESVKQFADYFEEFKLLSLLQLNNCAIHDEDLTDLLHALKNNKSVITLELNHNMITKKSSDFISPFFVLNHTIESIYMLKNKIRRSDLSKLRSSDLTKIICED